MGNGGKQIFLNPNFVYKQIKITYIGGFNVSFLKKSRVAININENVKTLFFLGLKIVHRNYSEILQK